MTHWKLTLAYDGTPYNGWQVQPGLPTVQGFLSDAIHHTTGEQRRGSRQGLRRSHRAPAMHALGQVASFTLAAPIPAANLHRALNRLPAPAASVCSPRNLPSGVKFHARHSALPQDL